MADITMKELLEAGVHFGHETKRWDPRMKPYIFGARNGIYIIDLQKTVQLFKEVYKFVRDLAAKGEYVLFVGTKKQAQESISEEATRCGMFYVNHRWLGGMMTNFQTIKKSIDRLKKLEAMKSEEIYNLLPKKEILELEKERTRLERSLGGIKKHGSPSRHHLRRGSEEGENRHPGRRERSAFLRSALSTPIAILKSSTTSFRAMTMRYGRFASLLLKSPMRCIEGSNSMKNDSRQKEPRRKS